MRFKWFLNNATEGAIALLKDPIGWDDIQLNLKRDMKLHGIISEFTFDLSFHCDGGGKDYIDNIYETQGVNALVSVKVDVQCEDETPFELFFNGRLNLTKYNRKINITPVNIEENNIRQVIKSRFDTPIDLAKITSIGGTVLSALPFAPYDIAMHSRALKYEDRWSYASLPQTRTDNYVWNTGLKNVTRTHDYPITKNELKNGVAGINDSSETPVSTSGISELLDTVTQIPLLTGTYKITWNVDGDFIDEALEGTTRTLDKMGFNFAYGQSLAALTAVTMVSVGTYTSSSSSAVVTPFTGSGSATFTIAANDKVWVYWFTEYLVTTTSGATDNIALKTQYDTFSLSIETIATTPATTARGSAIFEAFARITEAITDETNVFESTFFGRKNSAPVTYLNNGCGAFTAITSGLLIRGFDEINKPFSISLKTLFESSNALWNLGIGIDTVNGKEKLIIEEKDFFYSDTLILRIDNVRAMEMNIKESLFWSDVQIGYKDFRPEQINGLDEFATVHNYALSDVKRLEGKLTLISKLIASGAVIEETRGKDSVNFESEDFNFDNKPFVIALNQAIDGGGIPTGLSTPEQDENFTSTTNVLEPDSVYNLRYSVKRMLLRHLNVIGGAINKVTGSELKFMSGEPNATIESALTDTNCNGDFSGVNLVDNSNIAWDNANLEKSQLWIPEVYTFTYELSWTDYKTIRDNKNGYIEFSETTTNHIKGYLLDLSYDINKGTGEFKLLRKF